MGVKFDIDINIAAENGLIIAGPPGYRLPTCFLLPFCLLYGLGRGEKKADLFNLLLVSLDFFFNPSGLS